MYLRMVESRPGFGCEVEGEDCVGVPAELTHVTGYHYHLVLVYDGLVRVNAREGYFHPDLGIHNLIPC